MIIGVGIIIGGGFLEVTWLCFLFGSVLGVVLVLLCAPHLFLLPWNVCLLTGLAFMGSPDEVGEALSSGAVVCRKATHGLLRVLRIVVMIAVIVSIVAGLALLYKNHNEEKVAQDQKKAAQEILVENAKALERRALQYGKKWTVSGNLDPTSNTKIATTAFVVSSDGRCELTVQKRLNGGELTGLDCQGVKISEYEDIYVQFDTDNDSARMDLKSYSDGDGVYIPFYLSDEYMGYYMSYQNFIKGLVSANIVSIKIPNIHSDFWVEFSLNGSAKAINQLGKKI